jgi:hypothetical protein
MRALRTLAQVLCMAAMTGFQQTVPPLSLRRRALTTLRRTFEGLGARPTRVNLAGLKS